MPLAKSHGLPSKKQRKAKKGLAKVGILENMDEYNKADDLVSLVYVDICNGVSRSDILQKIQNGIYGNNPIKYRQSVNYYNAALDRFAVDSDIEAEKLRQMFYGRYEALLETAIKKNDLYNAKGILDSMCRIFGIERKTPDTAIMINSDKEGGVTVNFGFKKDDVDE